MNKVTAQLRRAVNAISHSIKNISAVLGVSALAFLKSCWDALVHWSRHRLVDVAVVTVAITVNFTHTIDPQIHPTPQDASISISAKYNPST